MRKEKKQNKKAKDLHINLKNGVSIRPSIDMSIERPVLTFFPLVQLMIAVVSSLSVIYMLPAFLSWEGGKYEVSNGTTVFMVVLLTSIAAMLSSGKEKFLKFTGLGYLTITAIYIMPHINAVVNGFMFTVNAYTKRAGFPKPLFAQTAANATWGELEMFLLAFSFVITLLIAFGCIFHINFPLEFLATFPIFELGTFWGWEPYTWSTMGMLFSWILVLSLSLINHTARAKNSDTIFAVHQRKKTFYLTSEKIKHGFFGLMSSAVVIITLVVFIGTTAYSLMHDSVRPASFKQLRHDISIGFRDMSQDISERAELITSPLPGRGKMIGGTNGGRLGLYDKLTFTGKMAMKVTTPQFSRSIYLRGYAAEKYEDNTWTPIKNDEASAEKFGEYGTVVLDYDYIQDIYYPQTGSTRTSISIHPINCNTDLLYAPYGSCYSQISIADEQKYDGMISPKKSKQDDDYEIGGTDLGGDLSWEDILAMEEERSLSGQSFQEFSVYDERVKNTVEFYQIPEQAIPSLDKVLDGAGIYTDMNISTIQYLLRNYFSANGYTYDLEPGVTPEDTDFVSYFLDEQKKGYCTYYASAGVMLMRRLGIPARYVEGYVVEPSQYTPEKSAITVTDRSAHAWCEVYISGCGWFPLELTPGYEDENPNLTNADKNIKKQPEKKQTVSTPEKSSSVSSSKPQTSRADSRSSSSRASSSKSESSKADSGSPDTSTSSDDSGSGNGVGGAGRGTGGGGGSSVDRTQLTYLLLIVGFMAAVAVTAAVRRKHNLSLIEKLTNSPDERKAVIGCYTTFLRYIQLLGVESGENLTDAQLAVKISEKLKESLPYLCSPFLDLSDAAVLAYMSESEIHEEESERSRVTLEKLRDSLYDILSTTQRFKAKWILGLY